MGDDGCKEMFCFFVLVCLFWTARVLFTHKSHVFIFAFFILFS